MLKKAVKSAARQEYPSARLRRMQYANIVSGGVGRWGLVFEGSAGEKYLAAEIIYYPISGKLLVEIYPSPASGYISSPEYVKNNLADECCLP